jgi:hypothetical protein
VVLQRLRAWWRVGHAQGKMLPGGWQSRHRACNYRFVQP